MKTVALELDDGIAWVSMNRPEKKNAISVEMAREMAELLDRLETDARCQVLVLTGAGETFGGRRAAEMRLVNESVPRKDLRSRVANLARGLQQKNPTVLRQAKTAFRFSSRMGWDEAADYLFARSGQSTFMDPERGRGGKR